MSAAEPMDIRLVAPPGLEAVLAEEARAAGFQPVSVDPGGVALRGGWPDVWRANLILRGAGRVLVRIGSFRAAHLAQLDKRARRFPWGDTLRPDTPVRVEATCKRSRIYHAGAARQRITGAIAETLGAQVTEDAALRVMVRIEDDLCTLSLDTSGAPLHQRGHKLAVGKAPLRETLAALFLRQAGYAGTETVVDPMCGSGTFPIEAAEIAAGLAPGRSRTFAFEQLATFDPAAFARLRPAPTPAQTPSEVRFFGADRDQGVIGMATKNAARAGVAERITFARQAVSDLERPAGPPGLVITNPPYGGRIGAKKALYPLYAALGQTLTARFSGWRAAIVTSEPGLAKATGLSLRAPGPPVAHGGLSVRLYVCETL